MNGRKFASVAGTVTVAGIAAYASYEHMRALSLHAGQSPSISAVLPLSVDGLVVVASVALVDGRQRKTSAWLAFMLGITASIVANVLAAGPSLVDRCVSAWPSVALLVTIEVIARGGRKLPEPVPEVTPHRRGDVALTVAGERSGAGSGTTQRASRKAPPSTTAAVKVASAAKRMPGASVSAIADKAGVSVSTVRRHLPPAGFLKTGDFDASPTGLAPAATNGFDVLAEVSS